MKTKIQKHFSLLFLTLAAVGLSGCVKDTSHKTVTFYNGPDNDDECYTVNCIDDVFHSNLGTAYKEKHMKFIGWSTYQSADGIITKEENIPYDSIKDYFVTANDLYLYAIYNIEVRIIFHYHTAVADEDLRSSYSIRYSSGMHSNGNGGTTDDKTFFSKWEFDTEFEEMPKTDIYGNLFKGWALDFSTKEIVVAPDIRKLSFYELRQFVDSKNEIHFHAIYGEPDIKLYQYNTNDEMAEIHIETKDHIAIDDSSLINPNEHKGKNGELPVYNYVKATISVNHCEDEYALNNVAGKVKVRGNYTSSYAKKPIRIKFDQKQKMLGLNNDNALKSWVLLANWKDSSMLRDAAAFYLGNALLESDGYYTSDFRFVKVYLNDSYNGVYLLVEQQQLDANRVNVPESKDEADSYKTGYMLEYDGYYKNEPENQKFTVNYDTIKNGNTGFTITNDIMNEEQYNFIKKVTQNIWNVVYDACRRSHANLKGLPYHTLDENGDYVVDETITTAKEAVEKVVDIKSLVNMYILHEILEDRDIGFSSFYFSLDYSENGNKKLTFNAPWDFDYAVGNSTFGDAMRATISTSAFKDAGRLDSTGKKFKADTVLKKEDFTIKNSDTLYCQNTDNPWFIVFSNQQWLWNAIYERFMEAKNCDVFTSLITMIDVLSSKYATDFEENFNRWPEDMGLKLNDYQPSIVTYFVTQKQAADFLQIWLSERIEGLEKAIKSKYIFS